MDTARVALCQIDAVVGDISGNRDRVLSALAEAESAQAQLAVFPELVLSGYPPEDLVHSPTFVRENMRALAEVAAATSECVAVVGFVESREALYNAAAVMADGEIKGIWQKELLPNYGVFDERRWFVPGSGDTPLFSIGDLRMGLCICEDAWSEDGPVVRQGLQGADLIVCLNASPYRVAAVEERSAMLKERSRAAQATIVYVNLVGGQDELVFDGGSMVVAPSEEIVANAAQFEESIAIFDIPVSAKNTAPILPVVTATKRKVAPAKEFTPAFTPWLSRNEGIYAALVLATRSYVEKNRFSDVVIGLSGGIDSSLVASIAADAIGASRVHGVAMPSRFSASSSHDDAALLAKNLGIDFRVIAIESVHEAFLELLAPHFSGRPPGVAEENLQARIRGTLLMALSNKFGWLVLTTSNKSETAVGFSTLYGDAAGGFAVIKDVPKTVVYQLCELRNARAGRDLIPRSVIEKPPSAELRPDQRDDDTLPPYDALDPILEGYVERDLSIEELVQAGADEKTARRVVELVDLAEYKRRQSPIGPRITPRGFGKDRRMPITNRFRATSAAVLGRSLMDALASAVVIDAVHEADDEGVSKQ